MIIKGKDEWHIWPTQKNKNDDRIKTLPVQYYYSKNIQKLPDVLMNGHLNRSGPITAIAMDSTTTTWLYRSPNSSSHLWSLGLFDCASSVNWTILLRVDSFQVFVTCNQLILYYISFQQKQILNKTKTHLEISLSVEHDKLLQKH